MLLLKIAHLLQNKEAWKNFVAILQMRQNGGAKFNLLKTENFWIINEVLQSLIDQMMT